MQRLREAGWTEGRNLAWRYRYAEEFERHRHMRRIGSAQSRCHCCKSGSDRNLCKAGTSHHSDRVHSGSRPGRHRGGREPRHGPVATHRLSARSAASPASGSNSARESFQGCANRRPYQCRDKTVLRTRSDGNRSAGKEVVRRTSGTSRILTPASRHGLRVVQTDLWCTAEPIFTNRGTQIVAPRHYHALPTIYQIREFR